MMCQRSLLRPYFDVSPAARAGSLVGDNEPHSVTDASDLTIPVRGEQRGLHHVAIEIRRTLSLTKRFSAGGWDFARLLPQAYQRVVAVPQAADELPSTTKEALRSAKPR
jgi:predicted N-formylglutamate amidohydrolase